MTLRRRFWIETAAASVAVVLFLLTLVWSDWIEIVFGWDPDQHSGTVEWAIVGGLLVIAAVLLGVVRAEWRRTQAASARPSSQPAD